MAAGGSSLDAVEATIRVLEDDPLFNAGRGSVFTADGRNELDASIMDGATLRAGAVAGVTRTRNPISLARAVMEKSPHVMLARDGADQFSIEQGLPQVTPDYFRTEERWQQLLDWRRDHAADLDPTHSHGTVGAVAIDIHGHLAAGTSTGGMTGKRWGRIGDSPVIGAGTYASDKDCAVSGTGSGEYFIRTSAARQLCDRIAWHGENVQAAASATIANIGGIGGDGGVIAMDGEGRIAFAMNTSGMYRGWVTSALPARTAIYSANGDLISGRAGTCRTSRPSRSSSQATPDANRRRSRRRAPTGYGDQSGRRAGLAQSSLHGHGLLVWHQRVSVAMDQQGGGGSDLRAPG